MTEKFKPDAELQALLDSMKESMDWEQEQMEKGMLNRGKK